MERDIYIQGERFSSADVTIAFLGRINQGVVSINWDEEQDVNPVRVVGNRKAVGHVVQNMRYAGSMTLLEEEVMGLQASLGSSLLKARTFPVTVGYWKNGVFIKQTLVDIKITKVGRSVESANAEGLQVSLDFVFFDFKPFMGN
jgi:hypothetical protein